MKPNIDDLSADRLLSAPECAELLGVSHWTFLAWNRNPLMDLPKPLLLGKRTRRWRLSELRAWLDQRDR